MHLHTTKKDRFFFLSVLLLLCCMTIFVAGCGKRTYNSDFEANLPAITSVDKAVELFGKPDAVVVQGDGLTRHSWIIHLEQFIDGHDVYVPGPYSAYRRSVFRIENDIMYRVYVPAHANRTYCFFAITTQSDGTLDRVTYEGNSCDLLLSRKTFQQQKHPLNSLPSQTANGLATPR